MSFPLENNVGGFHRTENLEVRVMKMLGMAMVDENWKSVRDVLVAKLELPGAVIDVKTHVTAKAESFAIAG